MLIFFCQPVLFLRTCCGFADFVSFWFGFTRVLPIILQALEEKYSTVGCVVKDKYGNLASAGSTGGLVNKQPGKSLSLCHWLVLSYQERLFTARGDSTMSGKACLWVFIICLCISWRTNCGCVSRLAQQQPDYSWGLYLVLVLPFSMWLAVTCGMECGTYSVSWIQVCWICNWAELDSSIQRRWNLCLLTLIDWQEGWVTLPLLGQVCMQAI